MPMAMLTKIVVSFLAMAKIIMAKIVVEIYEGDVIDLAIPYRTNVHVPAFKLP